MRNNTSKLTLSGVTQLNFIRGLFGGLHPPNNPLNSHQLRNFILYQPATYQIKVPGALDALWVDEASSFSITIEESFDGRSISILTGLMDQAMLRGLLRRLYGLGFPLISVICVEFVEKSINNE